MLFILDISLINETFKSLIDKCYAERGIGV